MIRRPDAGLRRAARAVVPLRLRARASAVAQRRGWIEPSPAGPFPFQYPFWETMAVSTSPYPQYQWGTLCAAGLAQALGIPRISVVEFGVAGGNGLVELERQAALAAEASGVVIDVHGFDTGTGLTKPVDHRDLPQMWQEGWYPMDPERLRARLSSAQLHLGPVAETVPAFLAEGHAPIGFVSFDLDLYSSTVDAFGVFRGALEAVLPRVVCYFDDVIGFSHGDFSGERLAISEFNDQHDDRKLSQIYGLRYVLALDQWWTHQMYLLHAFAHPRYNDEDGTNRLRDLPLR